ncbi:hypothetical protein QEN19_003362 [Hanseniaspora menglaensis]
MPDNVDNNRMMESFEVVGRKSAQIIDKESVGRVLDKWIKIPSDKLYNYIYEKSNKAIATSTSKAPNISAELIESASQELHDSLSTSLSLENNRVSNLQTSWNSFDSFTKSLVGYSVSASKGLFNGTISIFRNPKETLNSISSSATSVSQKLTDPKFYSDLFSYGKSKPVEYSAVGITSTSLVNSQSYDNELSENLFLNCKKTPFFFMPSKFIKKPYNFLKSVGDDIFISINDNRYWITSFIVAGLVINEIGVKYYKRKLNKKWNVLSYKEMNKKVVLVLGSMLDPITKIEVEDLLNRGFIVYVASGDVKNSPFIEELANIKKTVDIFKEKNETEDDFDKQSRKSGDILSDSTSDDEEEQPGSGAQFPKISDSDWIISSTECFSNVYASPQDFTRLNYMTSSKKDLIKLSKELKDKDWELVSIIFSHDNVSNNIKTSTEHFNNLILNNMMDLISSLYGCISLWPNSKVILFNNSLSKINERCSSFEKRPNEPSLEILCNNMVETVYDTLVESNYKNAFLVEIGLLRDVENRSLNYQYLQEKVINLQFDNKFEKGNSSIYNEFLNPVQNLIMEKSVSGVFYDRSANNVLYCGSLSLLNKNLASHLTNLWVLNYILFKQKVEKIAYTIFWNISQAWFTALIKINSFVSISSDWVQTNSKNIFKTKED